MNSKLNTENSKLNLLMKILKFGGSSVANAERIEKVLDILQAKSKSEKRIAVVFSAFGKVTDLLIELGTRAADGDETYREIHAQLEKIHIETADRLISLKQRSQVLTQIKLLLKDLEEVAYGVFLVKELTQKTLDYIMSFGERLSNFIISSALADRGYPNQLVDAREIIKTNSAFGQAVVDFKLTNKNINEYFNSKNNIFIVTGFIASTTKNETITLGRGGSDYTASILGAALEVDEIEIWTDVNGVMTADPRKVKEAFPVSQLSYEEAMELSHFGAKVIHPPTMQPALAKGIPIRIKNTFNPQFEGTLIGKQSWQNGYVIRGISSIDSVALLQINGSGMIGISGIAQRIFSALAKEQINIIMISQASSEHSICLAILPHYAVKAKTALEEELKYEIHYGHVNEVQIEFEMAIIAVVGERMRHTKGIAGKVFQTLAQNNVNISAIAQGSSELNISIVVSNTDEETALNALHTAFFNPNLKIVNLFIAGSGLVGSALLKQLESSYQKLEEESSIRIQLAGLVNSKKMTCAEDGLDFSNWQQQLESGKDYDEISTFFDAVQNKHLANSIFVDCTANAEITEFYPKLLSTGISVVTANKIANTQSQEKYSQLKNLERKNKVRFLYETNVGAGLPVVNTIKNIVSTNDAIIKMEGILSGTISYLFNSFDGSIPFSKLVAQAKELGYTEPDPRLDLSGMDVARKLLILIRESGIEFELADIQIEPFVPKEAMNAKNVDAFFKALQKADAHFENLYKDAQAKDKALRFIATYENGLVQLTLKAVDKSHPFYTLEGSDNILAIYSNYYNKQPLVIKGPGAGADVTAAGVYSDIIRTADYLS